MERERRAHERKLLSTAIAFHDPDGAPLRGFICDISHGGCFIASPSQLTFGERVEFEIRLNAQTLARGTGRVVWVRDKNERDRPAGMGIAFVDAPSVLLDFVKGLSVAGSRLSRPNTVIGIAPAPATSSPSFSPDVVLAELAGESEAPAHESPPIPPPIRAARPSPPRRKRWIALGAVVASAALATAMVIGVRRHRASSVVKHDAAIATDGAPVDAAPDVPSDDRDALAIAPITDASVLDARASDAGRDAGRVKRKPKPRRQK